MSSVKLEAEADAGVEVAHEYAKEAAARNAPILVFEVPELTLLVDHDLERLFAHDRDLTDKVLLSHRHKQFCFGEVDAVEAAGRERPKEDEEEHHEVDREDLPVPLVYELRLCVVHRRLHHLLLATRVKD